MGIMFFFNLISVFFLYKSVKNEANERLRQVKNKLEFEKIQENNYLRLTTEDSEVDKSVKKRSGLVDRQKN